MQFGPPRSRFITQMMFLGHKAASVSLRHCTRTHRTCRTCTRRFCYSRCTRHTHPCLPIAISSCLHRSIRLTDAIQHLSGRFLAAASLGTVTDIRKHGTPPSLSRILHRRHRWLLFLVLAITITITSSALLCHRRQKKKNTWRRRWRQRQSHASFLVVRSLSPSYTPNK